MELLRRNKRNFLVPHGQAITHLLVCARFVIKSRISLDHRGVVFYHPPMGASLIDSLKIGVPHFAAYPLPR